MALQLVLGGSGYGKSRYIFEDVIKKSLASPAALFYVIVPEQYTMQTEKDIIELHPGRGIMNIDVLSFRRLAYRVMEETGVTQLPLLDDIGKKLVLGKIVEEQKNNLILYKNKVKMPGFVEEIKSVIAELYQYGVGSEELDAMKEAAKKKPVLSAKLNDIALIRDSFQKFIDDKYITSEELLSVLSREIPKSEKLKECTIFLDGFTGFTPIQYKVIEALLTYAKDVVVTVTADAQADIYAGELKETLFGLSKTTATKLSDIAKKLNVSKEKDILLDDIIKSRYNECTELRFLERHLFRGDKSVYEKDMESISVKEFKNIRGEAKAVAGSILALVREGCRFQDMAVVTGDLEGYGEELSEAFAECGIPYFVDSKTKLMTNPFVQLIRSVFEIARTDYSYESVFALLRTGMVDIAMEDVDYLDNYCAVLGIRGLKKYTSTWTRSHIKGQAADFERLNTLREKLVTPLAKATEVLRDKNRTVREKMIVLYELICSEDYRCEEKLNAYKEGFEDAGEAALAKEFSQSYKLIIELFDKVVALLGEEKMPLEELIAIMDAGFFELKVGIIPPSVDMVLIGDIERSRLGGIKYLFFVGVNDGIVPKSGKNAGIISEAERNFLAEADFSLAPTSRQNLYIQRYYLYLNLTKPSKGLYISYSLMDGAGSARKPSVLIGQLARMFPGLKVARKAADFESGIMTPGSSIETFIEGLKECEGASENGEISKKQKLFEELYSWYLRSPEWRNKVTELVAAMFYSNKESKISKEVAAALYGPQPINSVTRLEQYAACAYAHFLLYGLKIREQGEYEVTARDLGNLFHAAIEVYGKKLKEKKLSWTEVDEAMQQKLVKEAVEEVTVDYKASVLASSARNAYISNRLERITMRTVWALSEQLKKGDFVPRENEVVFSETEGLKALTIDLGDGRSMKLQGRIDRLDVCDDGDNRYIKVIDYKSGTTKFDLSQVYYGLKLQLVLYMEAVRESEAKAHPDKNVISAGMFYYNIADPIVDEEPGKSEEDIRSELLKSLCVNGLVSSVADSIRHFDKDFAGESSVIPVSYKKDGGLSSKSQVVTGEQYDIMCNYVKDKIKDMGLGILEGDIAKSPYVMEQRSGCDYCNFKAICGYDEEIKGFEPRRFNKLGTEKVFEKMKGEKDNGGKVE
ncbi:MAG: helicase-exonuclease AddAB subunit AddB [Lachnospiraceae bacterium]|nr:helicase-exonuclease AddAB subunit AddB [Lachnospiraceae bacterium]